MFWLPCWTSVLSIRSYQMIIRVLTAWNDTLWQKKLKHTRIDLLNEPFSFLPMDRQGKTFNRAVHSTNTFLCSTSSMYSPDWFNQFFYRSVVMIWPNKRDVIFAYLLEPKKYTIREDNDLWISSDDSMFMAVITKDWPIHGGHLPRLMEIKRPDSSLNSHLSCLGAMIPCSS